MKNLIGGRTKGNLKCDSCKFELKAQWNECPKCGQDVSNKLKHHMKKIKKNDRDFVLVMKLLFIFTKLIILIVAIIVQQSYFFNFF